MSKETRVMRKILRVSPEGIQRIREAPHVHFHHLTDDSETAQGKPCEVEMCCHSCGKAAIVRFSMSTISVTPTPLRMREIDMIRNEFVQKHRQCKPDERVDYLKECPPARDGDHAFYDLSADVS